MSSRPARFTGKVVVVTGGSRGIGQAVAVAFLAEGAHVAVLDITAPEDDKSAAFHVRCNVANEENVKEAIDAVASKYGGVDILVNNAAAFIYGTVDQVTSEQWDRILGVNVKGYAFTQKYCIPHMKRRGGGAIVNLSSISAFCGQEAFVPYSLTKASVLQMTKNVAMDVGRFNIRVNAVCPGAILTEATALHAASLGKTVDDIVSDLT